MKNSRILFCSRAVLMAALLFSTSAMLLAGAPLICHPFEVGDAQSLPWGSGPGWKSPLAAYDVRALVPDTLALLTPKTPVLVRMETMRRAAIYGERNPSGANALLAVLMARALDAANSENAAAAWFDAGYLLETYRHAKGMRLRKAASNGAEDPIDGFSGYAWVVKSIKMAGGDPAMDFAAALMSDGPWPNSHFRKALAGASDGSLLARTLLSHYGEGRTKSVAELRQKFAASSY